MKVNFDTSNWFKDRNFTVIVITLVLTVVNTILLSISLCHKCPKYDMPSNFSNQWIHTMMMRK